MTRGVGMRMLVAITVAVAISAASGCRSVSGAKGKTPEDKKATILADREKALQKLYAQMPEAKAKVENAAGYGVFSNLGLKIFLAGSESGYGVVKDNKTGEDTFMRMAGASVGLGFAANDYTSVIIFYDPATLRKFVTSGWEFTGQAGAGAAAGSKGAGATGAAGVKGVEVYRLTKNGFVLQATVQGIKYWRDTQLSPNMAQ
jgi:lipid-binding SYLF domain-containing protein